MGCFTSKQDVSQLPASPTPQPLQSLPLQSLPPKPSFSLFSSLPPRIRLKIWSFVSLEPRNILIRHSMSATYLGHPQEGWDWSCHPECLNTPFTPPVLHATRESRAEALKYYQLKFGSLISSNREYGFTRDSIWNGGIFNTPGIYINVDSDRVCLLQAEVKLIGRHKMYVEYPYMRIAENSQQRGTAAFICEAATNGTKYIGLMGPRDIRYDSVLPRSSYPSTIPQDLGAWDSPPFSNASFEEVLFFTDPKDLDIPKTRGTWRIKSPHYSIPLENLANEVAGLDTGKLLASAKERIWLSAFNKRVVEYRPTKREMKWPNIGYTLIE